MTTAAATVWVTSFDVTLAAAVALAFWKGGGPERVMALMYVAARLGTLIALPHHPIFARFDKVIAAIDFGLFIILWFVAIYANRWWPLVACAAQAISCSGHLMKLMDPGITRVAYTRMAAFSGWPTLVLLIAGTLIHVHRRRFRADPSWSSSLPSEARLILERLRMG